MKKASKPPARTAQTSTGRAGTGRAGTGRAGTGPSGSGLFGTGTSSAVPLWPGSAPAGPIMRFAWLPLAVPAVLVSAVAMVVAGFLLSWWIAVLVALCVGWLAGAGLWRAADTACAKELGISTPPGEVNARVSNMAEGLCASFGLSVPTLWLVDDPAPNIASFGRNDGRYTIVVTSGLQDEFAALEVEAILSHELSHLRAGHSPVSTAAVAARRLRIPNFVVARFVRDSFDLESQADSWALSVTRYPPALASALGKLREPNSAKCLLWAKSSFQDDKSFSRRLSSLAEL